MTAPIPPEHVEAVARDIRLTLERLNDAFDLRQSTVDAVSQAALTAALALGYRYVVKRAAVSTASYKIAAHQKEGGE